MPNFGTSDCEVWEISSDGVHESRHQLRRTWPDLFDSQLSDIEYCSEAPSSPATTEIDTDSEPQLIEMQDQRHDNINCKKRKCISHANDDVHSQDYEQKEQRCSNGIHDPSSVLGRGGFSFQEFDSDGIFGFNNIRSFIWDIPTDPVETFSDDDVSHVMTGVLTLTQHSSQTKPTSASLCKTKSCSTRFRA